MPTNEPTTADRIQAGIAFVQLVLTVVLGFIAWYAWRAAYAQAKASREQAAASTALLVGAAWA